MDGEGVQKYGQSLYWSNQRYDVIRISLIIDLIPNECVEMVRHYLDFIRMAHYESHTDATLNLMEEYLQKFWDKLVGLDSAFVTANVVEIGWYCPKMHYLRHYTQYIREQGCLPYCSTDRTEPYHIPIKDSYRASNRGREHATFIVRDEARDYGWARWEEGLFRRLTCPSDSPLETTMVKKTVTGSKASRWDGFLNIVTVERDNQKLVGLEHAMRHFLRWVRGGRKGIRKRPLVEANNVEVLYIHGISSITVTFPTVHDPRIPLKETLHSTPIWHYNQDRHWNKPRYDTAMIRYSNETDDGGTMTNRRIARIFLFFQYHDKSTMPQVLYNLAFGQMFSHSSQPDKHCGMYKLKKTENFEVFEIDTIERGVHLIPIYGKAMDTKMASPKTDPALDRYDDFYLNNQIDLHAFNTIF